MSATAFQRRRRQLAAEAIRGGEYPEAEHDEAVAEAERLTAKTRNVVVEGEVPLSTYPDNDPRDTPAPLEQAREEAEELERVRSAPEDEAAEIATHPMNEGGRAVPPEVADVGPKVPPSTEPADPRTAQPVDEHAAKAVKPRTPEEMVAGERPGGAEAAMAYSSAKPGEGGDKKADTKAVREADKRDAKREDEATTAEERREQAEKEAGEAAKEAAKAMDGRTREARELKRQQQAAQKSGDK